ncbi:hypothetical protein FHS27_006374 [Rhodopirellula rubra]|uniref:Uncharacterized protein n=1 Tax=Aporhodopirellula rubra TaxID=980271 RepID=A0A7W5E751_9BACT|nr:hypothetical protein [Aporhodopirellula rubra]MBB3210527.1 hypothetical protein [Aporhodopirellula rubra]
MAYVDTPASNTLSTARDMHFRLDGGVVLNPVAALALWDRIVALPHGDQMRCHTPRYAVHLNFDENRYFTAAICWECNNISISSSGEYSWQTFDGQSDAAQSLLAYIRELVPEVEPES